MWKILLICVRNDYGCAPSFQVCSHAWQSVSAGVERGLNPIADAQGACSTWWA